MRERLIQVGKMLLYLLFYILMQRMVAYVVAFVYSFVDSVRYGKSHPGESIPQEVMEQMIDRINEFLFNNSAWFTVVSVILTLLCLWVFFLIRKKKFQE